MAPPPPLRPLCRQWPVAWEEEFERDAALTAMSHREATVFQPWEVSFSVVSKLLHCCCFCCLLGFSSYLLITEDPCAANMKRWSSSSGDSSG
ncbi:unnamed protein product [Urochloa humidicola]